MSILPEIRAYNMSLPWKLWFVFVILFSLGLVISVVYFIVNVVIDDFKFEIGEMIFLLILFGGLAMGTYYLWYCVDVFTGKLVIEDERLVYKSLLKKRILKFSEIHGFKTDLTWSGYGFQFSIIAILPFEKIEERKISISQYVSNQDELLAWLQAHFKLLQGRKHLDY